ncbi:hypothetical protein NBRC10513v2_002302 [Rhodotorula toruloides]
MDILPSALPRREPTLSRDSAVVHDDAGPSGLPRPAGATASGLRRLTRSLTGGSDASGSSTAGSSGATSGSRCRTFGGLATLPPVREDGPPSPPPALALPPTTPMTRSRTSRERESDEPSSSENDRRLRRRTIAGASTGSETPTRKGLR